MKKEKVISNLEFLIEHLKKEHITIESCGIKLSNGIVHGVDPDNFSWQTNHHDGHTSLVIKMDIYDIEKDDSANAYDPMVELFKQAGLNPDIYKK